MKISRLIASGALAITITSFAQVPVITSQPQSQQVLAGDSVTLNVAATSATPLSYQWVVNGGTFVGQTNASLGFNNVQVSNTASYYVIVKNASGPTNSAMYATRSSRSPRCAAKASNGGARPAPGGSERGARHPG